MYETSPWRKPLRARVVVGELIGGSFRVPGGRGRVRRRRRAAAKAGWGARGVIGVRRASKGSACRSGIAAPFVDMAELPAGPHEQGLGGGHGAVEDGCGLGTLSPSR